MGGLFISYRRDDSSGYAGRIYECLCENFPDGYVFIDLNIPPGADFVATIQDRIASSDALIVLIGNWWSKVPDSDWPWQRRLDNPTDLVRLEIKSALQLKIPIIPVLVGRAQMPSDLPKDIAALSRFNAFRVSDEAFDESMKSFVYYLRRHTIPASSEASHFAAHRELETYKETGKGLAVELKVALIGASGVGKTSLVRRYVESLFSESYITSVGVQIRKKVVRVGAREAKLIIWDTAGEDNSKQQELMFMRGSGGAICVADGLRHHTLDKAMEMGSRLERDNAEIIRVLAVNKADLIQDWEVTAEELRAIVGGNWTVFTTSAKTGKGVEELFTSLARTILGKWGPLLS